MPRISEMMVSKFLKKEDVGEGTICTIEGVSQENVAKEGADQELKWVLHFSNLDKPLVLNSTNLQLIAKFLGSEESDDWEGKKIILYDDPSVSFGGKLTGGIRVRAYKGKNVELTFDEIRKEAIKELPKQGHPKKSKVERIISLYKMAGVENKENILIEVSETIKRPIKSLLNDLTDEEIDSVLNKLEKGLKIDTIQEPF